MFDDYEEDGIAFLDGRPNRNNVIDQNDIIDLQIALGTANTIKEFCAMV